MLSPCCGLSLKAKKCGLGQGLGFMKTGFDVVASASYCLASTPRHNLYASGQYAMLAPLLQHVMCVPASSAPAARVFSQSALIIKPNRARMMDKILEELVFLK